MKTKWHDCINQLQDSWPSPTKWFVFSIQPPVPPPPPSSLRFLFLDVGSTQSRLHAAPHLCVKHSAQKDHARAQPVPGSEGVLEVKDGEDEADELSQSHHQSDGQRGALCGQDEDAADAYVSGNTGLKSE